MTAPLTTDRLAPMFRSRFGKTYRHSMACESTQDQLLATDPEGTIAVCEEQTSGRGRRGRPWETPAGRALLASIVLRPDPGLQPAQLTLVAGVVVATVIEREIRIPVRIKWPNDVRIGQAKVAGILDEQRRDAVVLGVGINVNQNAGEFPAHTRLQPTSLRVTAGRAVDRAKLLVELVYDLEVAYRAWSIEGLSTVSDELAERDVLRGRPVRVGDVDGVGAGIDTGGALLVDTPEGRRSVVAGEVTVTW